MTGRASGSNFFSLLGHLNLGDRTHAGQQQGVWRTMIPDPQSEFWDTYGNKVRVNGTVEEVCHIRQRQHQDGHYI